MCLHGSKTSLQRFLVDERNHVRSKEERPRGRAKRASRQHSTFHSFKRKTPQMLKTVRKIKKKSGFKQNMSSKAASDRVKLLMLAKKKKAPAAAAAKSKPEKRKVEEEEKEEEQKEEEKVVSVEKKARVEEEEDVSGLMVPIEQQGEVVNVEAEMGKFFARNNDDKRQEEYDDVIGDPNDGNEDEGENAEEQQEEEENGPNLDDTAKSLMRSRILAQSKAQQKEADARIEAEDEDDEDADVFADLGTDNWRNYQI